MGGAQIPSKRATSENGRGVSIAAMKDERGVKFGFEGGAGTLALVPLKRAVKAGNLPPYHIPGLSWRAHGCRRCVR